MAAPITSMKRTEQTDAQIQQEKLEQLQASLAKQEQAIQQLLELSGELQEMGALDAVHAMLQAKEKIAGIAIDQASREPVTNLINNVMAAAASATAIDPEMTKKIVAGVERGLHEAELGNGHTSKVGLLQLAAALNDPDINRAVKFGLNFLKGMGKGLSEENSETNR